MFKDRRDAIVLTLRGMLPRIGISLPIIVLLECILYYIGYNGGFLQLVIGFLSYAAADFYLATPDQRNAAVQRIIYIVGKYGMVAMVCAASIWVISRLSSTAYAENTITNPHVLHIFNTVCGFGILILCMIPVYTFVANIMNGVHTQALLLISRTLTAFAFYTAVLWFITHHGDAAYQWYFTHPHGAVDAAVSTVILLVMLRFASFGRLSSGMESSSLLQSDVPFTYAYGRSKISALDVDYAAAHESGHVLVYAALGIPNLPDDLLVNIKSRPDYSGVLAFVGHNERPRNFGPNVLTQKAFSEWHMLVLLAGTLGEEYILKASTLGAVTDNDRWVDTAKAYLANQYAGMYYPDPKNQFEQAVNNNALVDLRDGQLSVLHQFMDMNEDILRGIFEALRSKKSLHRTDLIPFLSRVIFPDGFPVLADIDVFTSASIADSR